MPRYSYIAKALDGDPKKGFLEAKDEHDLARILRAEGYILISANFGSGEVKKKTFTMSIPFLDGIKTVDKIMFARNLQVMVKAGVTLTRALKILSDQLESKKFKKVILEIKNEIVKGENFSEVLKKYPKVFSPLFCNMVRVGEESGKLEEVLENLSQQMEKDYELKSKVMGAMVYPAVIITAMIGIGILMLVVVVPQLAKTFAEIGVELPIGTRIVMAIGNLLAKFWYLIPVVILGAGFLFKSLLKTKSGKSAFDMFIIRVPIISPIIRKTNVATTLRTLSSLTSAGVPIVKSLELVAGALTNVHYKRAILGAAKEVQKGSKLAESLEKYPGIYPTLVIQMIAVGEETGETSDILHKLAEFYENEVANAAKNLSAVIEPVLMLFIGAIIGLFAVSMIQPMYSMMGAI